MNKKERGQALVEFAGVFFVVAVLALLAVHGYLVGQAFGALHDAAEVGADTAALFGSNTSEVATAIEHSLAGNHVSLPYVYTVTIYDRRTGAPKEQANIGDPIYVNVQYTAPIRFVFVDLPLRSQTALRYAELDSGW